MEFDLLLLTTYVFYATQTGKMHNGITLTFLEQTTIVDKIIYVP